ncbi:MAG TPA: hypothetical protein VFF67_04645 [Thermoplasmata archaeon]|nr:hypothetical protein [Thermoplasmata archaeon]
MTGRSAVGPEPARNRCRCGHFPATHMRVLPVTDGHAGGYRLDPSGPCTICGEAACARFTATA